MALGSKASTFIGNFLYLIIFSVYQKIVFGARGIKDDHKVLSAVRQAQAVSPVEQLSVEWWIKCYELTGYELRVNELAS